MPNGIVAIMRLAADAFRRRQLVLRTPGEKPRLHVLVLDEVAGLHLAIGLADFRNNSFLVGDRGLHRIGDDSARLWDYCTTSGGYLMPEDFAATLRLLDEALTRYVRPDTFPLAIRMIKPGEAVPEGVKVPSKSLGEQWIVCQ